MTRPTTASAAARLPAAEELAAAVPIVCDRHHDGRRSRAVEAAHDTEFQRAGRLSTGPLRWRPSAADITASLHPASPMAKRRTSGVATSAASGLLGLSGLASARGGDDDVAAPQVPYSAVGRVAALEMVAAAQRASQCSLKREALDKLPTPKKPVWHGPTHTRFSLPPRSHDVRHKQLLGLSGPPSAEELLEIIQLTHHVAPRRHSS